jgi:tRNA-dihydrouridine synthase 3
MKVKGRNKQRPVTHIKAKDKLCPTIFQEKDCRFGEKCKFSHDVKSFMETKPKDISPECIVFESFGKCPFGVACRYGSKHISEEYKNIVNQELYEEKSKVGLLIFIYMFMYFNCYSNNHDDQLNMFMYF